MPYTYLPTSTLSAALNETDLEFSVASTTNITAGKLLVFKNETMHVREVPVSGRVKVRRGYDGSRALKHKAGDTFYIGSASDFKTVREAALGLFGDGAQLPTNCIPGSRAFDVNGYEYVLLDLTGTTVQGATVGISKDGLFRGTILTTAHSGPVGVIMETGTSDQWVWALIKGLYQNAEATVGSCAATSTGVCLPASSASTPSVGLLVVTTSQASSIYATTSAGIGEYPVIHGMWPASSTTTGTTASSSAHTGQQIDVWLHYPYMDRKLSS